MSRNPAFYDELDQIVREVRYGQITLAVQVHEGRVVSIIGTKFEHRQYKDDGTEPALAEFLTKIKESRKEEKTGSITGTLKMHKGKVKEMIIQSNFKKYI